MGFRCSDGVVVGRSGIWMRAPMVWGPYILVEDKFRILRSKGTMASAVRVVALLAVEAFSSTLVLVLNKGMPRVSTTF